MDAGRFFLGGKGDRGVNFINHHLLVQEFKNMWSYTFSLSHIFMALSLIKQKDNFEFY
jgi:hypothetical protein